MLLGVLFLTIGLLLVIINIVWFYLIIILL
jgi:hypothetical protein